jgi:hypothetical protein
MQMLPVFLPNGAICKGRGKRQLHTQSSAAATIGRLVGVSTDNVLWKHTVSVQYIRGNGPHCGLDLKLATSHRTGASNGLSRVIISTS